MENWIDRQAEIQGLDPGELEAASRQLMQELERTQSVGTRAQWKRLAELIEE